MTAAADGTTGNDGATGTDACRPASAPGLEVVGCRRLGTLGLEVDLVVPAGTTVAVVGPNGAGKTTLLRLVAGLLALDEGRIRLDGRYWDDVARRRWIPPEQRSVGFVFQNGLLFPHLSVGGNVAFGLRARGTPTDAARATARDWLDRVGLADRFDDPVTTLSAGQAQRVGLARALAGDPGVLLLDEPLSALDAAVRDEIRALLAHHLRAHRGVRLFVTHDPDEAVALGDRIVVLEAGRITQHGTPGELERIGYLARLFDRSD